jgi:predicted HD phosphohydrolase
MDPADFDDHESVCRRVFEKKADSADGSEVAGFTQFLFRSFATSGYRTGVRVAGLRDRLVSDDQVYFGRSGDSAEPGRFADG